VLKNFPYIVNFIFLKYLHYIFHCLNILVSILSLPVSFNYKTNPFFIKSIKKATIIEPNTGMIIPPLYQA